MATSAFKSASRRGNPPSADNTPKKAPPPRRSKSVSAFSRTQLDLSTDFSNKRDNPLFWSTGSPLGKETESEPAVGEARFVEVSSKSDAKASTVGVGDARRGRSVSRNADVANKGSVNKKEAGKSLPRVDTGRRVRSVSRGPASRSHFVTSESEVEQDSSSSSNYRNRSHLNLNSAPKIGGKVDVLSDQLKSRRTWSSQHPSTSAALDDTSRNLSSHWEDGVSTSSLSGAEEKTIKAVFEQMKPLQGDHLGSDTPTSGIYETVRSEVRRALSDIQNDLESAIRRSNAAGIATTNVADIPPETVNPGAVELVLDIRSEYAKKFEQSQERARKLRADLAIEEHRTQELGRILKEVLPDPQISTVQKPRPVRKASIERRKMSKRLTEEAMAYFDECVSLSTFDSSDFSSPEDPPISIVGYTTPASKGALLPPKNADSLATYCPDSCLNNKQELDIRQQFTKSHGVSGETASSGSNEAHLGEVSNSSINAKRVHKFSFSCNKPTEPFELQQDIRKYVKNLETDKSNTQVAEANNYNADDYTMHSSTESMLFDRVLLGSRIESGSLLVCGGGLLVPFSPFGSVI